MEVVFCNKQKYFFTQYRYELHFLVSDTHWGQTDVAANMTVEVRHLSPESLAHAVPITLMPTSPSALAAAWSPQVR